MIIFDLDGTLADCEHRRYFVDKMKDHPEYFRKPCLSCKDGSHHKIDPQFHKITGKQWEPDWKSFYEACDQDKPIMPVVEIIKEMRGNMYTEVFDDMEIWSGRCESVRDKTEKWLKDNGIYYNLLKMRPIGDNTPDDQLKESWLKERCNHISLNLDTGKETWSGHGIDFVFDDRPKVVRMWQKRGIFVFNCCQHDQEF